VVLEPVVTCRCGDLACRTKIRKEVTEELEKIPDTWKVIRYVRPIYACRACLRIM
jgi:transposase